MSSRKTWNDPIPDCEGGKGREQSAVGRLEGVMAVGPGDTRGGTMQFSVKFHKEGSVPRVQPLGLVINRSSSFGGKLSQFKCKYSQCDS